MTSFFYWIPCGNGELFVLHSAAAEGSLREWKLICLMFCGGIGHLLFMDPQSAAK